MNAPLRGAEPDRQRYRGWIIQHLSDGLAFWKEEDRWTGIHKGIKTVAGVKQYIDSLEEDEDGDPNEPDEGPAVIYSAEEEMAFIAEAERREMYAREEYEGGE